MLLRRVARPLLAALFISGGITTLRSPQGHVEAARPVLDAVAPAVDRAVEVSPLQQRPDDEMLVRIDAGVKVVAGTMLALGKFPRLASTALAASLVPTTLAAHRFWEETDPEAKLQQQIHFLKNAGLLGGLLIAAADTEGKPSLGWKGRRAARRASAKLADLTDSTPDLGERLQGVTDRVSGAASGVGGRVSGAASDVSGRVTSAASDAGSTVSGLAAGLIGAAPAAGAAVSSRASSLGDEVGRRAAKARKLAEKRQAAWEKEAEKRRAELLKRAEKQRKQLQKAQLEKKAAGVLDQVTTQAARLGQDVAVRATAVGQEIAQQAEGAAKDARRRVGALSSS